MIKSKPENLFFLDTKNKVSLSYSKLLKNVISADFIVTDGHFENAIDFLTNFITALYYGVDIKINDLEVSNPNKNEIFKISKLKKVNNISELINVVRKSNSKITLLTSGTTGQPKEIIHSVSNLIREVRTGKRFEDNKWAFAYNPTHIAGIQVFFQAFLNKNPMFYIFQYSKSEIIDIISRFKITNISATPTFYRLITPLKKPIIFVNKVSLGGEKSSQNLVDKIEISFPNAKILNIYASTEAGTIFSTSGRYFKIMPDKIKYVKVKNNELLINKKLLGEGNNIDTDDVWYRTGDLVKIVNSKTKEFIFTSRKNEMINVGGNNVNPIEVEGVIDQIDGVEKSYIYAKPNPILGNMLYVKIILNNNSLTEMSLKRELNNKLEKFQIPRRIEFVDSLPVTRSGKLKRKV